MRYVPSGPDLHGVPNVTVDANANAATVLELSPWPGNKTPGELKADTSTEIAVNYLRSPQPDSYRRGAEAVTSCEFGIDGLMALWALLNPQEALQRADLLVAVAECGAFDRWPDDRAAKTTCAIRGFQTLPSSPIYAALAGLSDPGDRAALLYRETLAMLPQLLRDVDEFEAYWRDEFDSLIADRELMASGETSLQDFADIDLAVFQLPRAVHDLALYEQTRHTRVLLVIEEATYEVRYRYESWVELQSRNAPPRIDLRPFAELLETFEGSLGTWVADDVREQRPRLRLRDPGGEVSHSSVTSGLFVRLLAAFLRDNAANPDLVWSPELAKEANSSEPQSG